MRQIQGVKLEPARNAAHYELVHQILLFAQACQAVQQNMAAEFQAFKLAVDEEGRILGISLRSDLTEKIAATDRERDGEASGARILTNALTHNPTPEIAEAAEQVLNQMISLKVDNEANYLQQTGQIDILVETLTSQYASQLELLGLTKPIQFLKAANDRMHELLNQRDLEQADRVGTAMQDARRATDAAFRAFKNFYNAWILVNAAALEQDDLGTTLFSTEANAKIEYFKRYVLKEPASSSGADSAEEEEGAGGGSEGTGGAGTGGAGTGGTGTGEGGNTGTGGEGAGSGEGGSETQEMVTITFHYHDGREVVKQYPKGTILSQTTLEVPEHSPGYTWGNYHMPLNYDMTINEYNPNEL